MPTSSLRPIWNCISYAHSVTVCNSFCSTPFADSISRTSHPLSAQDSATVFAKVVAALIVNRMDCARQLQVPKSGLFSGGTCYLLLLTLASASRPFMSHVPPPPGKGSRRRKRRNRRKQRTPAVHSVDSWIGILAVLGHRCSNISSHKMFWWGRR